jgi:ubiquinone/menaquinone biosynthesis C-methylase UbiE
MTPPATVALNPRPALAAAFDALAPLYDAVWSDGFIGRLQRAQVWRVLLPAFQRGECVLDIGCGTGTDASRLAEAGVRVHATDISPVMLDTARRRIGRKGLGDMVTFELNPVERLSHVKVERLFDGAYSDFGVLNCVSDLGSVANALAHLIRPEGKLIICLMSPFCLWETVWYLLHARPSMAFRRQRARGKGIEASLGSRFQLRVYYHSIRQLAASLSGGFELVGYRAVGLLVPPSYLEEYACRRTGFFRRVSLVDQHICSWPVLRGAGDHLLAVFVRTKSNRP